MVRILVSAQVRELWAGAIATALQGQPHCLRVLGETALPEADIDIAFLSRDIAGTSAKTVLAPSLQRFYQAIRGAGSLQWLQLFSAGADRPIYREMAERGVAVTTASGAGTSTVAHAAIGGMLALARRLPRLFEAQQQRHWASLHDEGLAVDLVGARAVVVGQGPIGREISRLATAFGLDVTGVRHRAAAPDEGARTVGYADIDTALARADWVFIACPSTPLTRGLFDRQRLNRLPAGARLINVARGDIVDEAALISVLETGRLGGAFLDVFAHEPLDRASPLWSLPSVIVTPHSASHSTGHADRVARIFLANLERWQRRVPLENRYRP